MIKKALCAIMAFCMLFTMVGVTGAVAVESDEEPNVKVVINVADELMTYKKSAFTAENVLKIDLSVEGIDPMEEEVMVLGKIKLNFDGDKANVLKIVNPNTGKESESYVLNKTTWPLGQMGYDTVTGATVPGKKQIRLNFGTMGEAVEPDWDDETESYLPVALITIYLQLPSADTSLNISVDTSEMVVTNTTLGNANGYTWEFNATEFTFGTPATPPPSDMTGVTVTGGNYTYDGQSHSVAVNGAPAGSTITYTCNGEAFTGAKDAGTYEVTAKVECEGYNPYTASANVVIEPKELTVTGLVATDREENSTTTVALTGGSLVGIVSGDDVSATMPAIGTIADAAAGTNKAVTVPAISLTGSAAANYTLVQPTGITVNIIAKTPSGGGGDVDDEETDVKVIVDVADELMTYKKGAFTAENVLKIDLSVEGIDPMEEEVMVLGKIKLNFDGDKAKVLKIVNPNTGKESESYVLNKTTWPLGQMGYDTETGAAVPGKKQIRLNFGTMGDIVEPEWDDVTESYLPVDLVTIYIQIDEEDAVPGLKFNMDIDTSEMVVTNTTLGNANGYSWSFNDTAFTFEIADNRQEMTGVTVSGGTYDYDGTVRNVTVSGAPADATTTYTCNGEAFTGAKNAGTYEVTAKVEHADYKTFTNTATIVIEPKEITVSGITGSKVYDKTANVTLTGGTLNDVVSGDVVSLGTLPAGTLSSVNVGEDIAVTLASDITLTGANAANYTLVQPVVTANITPATITLTGKVIKQTNTEEIPTELYSITSGQLFGSDVLTGAAEIVGLTGEKTPGTYVISKGTLANNNYNITFVDGTLTLTAGQNVTTTLPSIINATYGDAATESTLTLDANNATAQVTVKSSDTSVATVAYADGKITVTPVKAGSAKITVEVAGTEVYDKKVIESNITVAKKTLTIAELDAVDREYDGSKDVALTGTLTGVEDDDDVSFPKTATISSKNAGTYEVTLPALTGADVANYVLEATNPDVVISKKPLVATVEGVDREYDATTNFEATAELTGVVAGDTVTVDCTEGALDSKNVGTRTGSVEVSIAGADAANYTLATATFTVDVEVSSKEITASVAGVDRVYNATTNFEATATLAGVINGDDVDVDCTEGALDSENVGTRTGSVEVSLTGTDADNYTLQTSTFADVAVEVSPKEITTVVTATDRVYDATTAFVATATLDGVIDGDFVETTTTGTLSSKNAASYTDATAVVTLIGADAANYVLAEDTFNNVAVEISKKDITAAVTVTDRVYDATTAFVATATLDGVIEGDVVDVAAAGTLANKNAGVHTDATVAVTITGADADNYNLTNSNIENVEITVDKVALTISGITATNRKVDGTTAVVLNTSNAVLSGVIDGDVVSAVIPETGSVESASAGTNKAVTIEGIVLDGADAANYTVTAPTDVTVNITSSSGANYRPSSYAGGSTSKPVTPDKDDNKEDVKDPETDDKEDSDKEDETDKQPTKAPVKATANVSLKNNANEIRFVETDKEGNFYPDADATRNEVINALNEVLDITDATGECELKDVEDAENADIVKLFTKASIISGYEDGTFRGNDAITRAEFVKILAVALGVDIKEFEEDKFQDIADHWSADYVNSFVELGYIIGYPDGTFKPDEKISKAEVVIVINRVIDKKVDNTDNSKVEISDIDETHWAYDYIMSAIK